jgi:hypothetical protein
MLLTVYHLVDEHHILNNLKALFTKVNLHWNKHYIFSIVLQQILEEKNLKKKQNFWQGEFTQSEN